MGPGGLTAFARRELGRGGRFGVSSMSAGWCSGLGRRPPESWPAASSASTGQSSDGLASGGGRFGGSWAEVLPLGSGLAPRRLSGVGRVRACGRVSGGGPGYVGTGPAAVCPWACAGWEGGSWPRSWGQMGASIAWPLRVGQVETVCVRLLVVGRIGREPVPSLWAPARGRACGRAPGGAGSGSWPIASPLGIGQVGRGVWPFPRAWAGSGVSLWPCPGGW